MLRKQIKAYTLLLLGITSTILSVIILYYGKDLLKIIIYLIGFELILSGILHIILSLFRKKKQYKLLDIIIKSSINILFGIIVIAFYKSIMASFTLIFGFYILLIAFTNLISYIIYTHYNIKGKLGLFLNFLINIIFSIILFMNPSLNIKYVLIILSIYLILYGIKNLLHFITTIIPTKTINKIKSRIEISIPIMIAMFLPQVLIREINQMLEVETSNKFNYEKPNKDPDLFVIIHLAKNGSASFGHMEIAYKGKTYSYGNYNMHNRKLFESIGDGIILIADKDKYIDYCVNQKGRYLVEFGLILTDKQKTDIEKRIDKLINENTIDFYSDLELYEKGQLEKRNFNDMSSEIYKYASGSYKKITKGKNKIFFVLKNNCAVVAGYILKGTGAKIIAINGIISPGTYYDYLNNSFLIKNTNVVTRKLYIRSKEEPCQNYQK